MGDNMIILDEELEEIEYYEIMSIEDMIKDNPDFKAFSREEIYDELYNFFQNSNTAENLTEMFYKKKKDFKNYVFISDAGKNQYGEESTEEFIGTQMKLSKLQYLQGQNGKNTLFFAIDYDTDSKKLRLKPTSKTLLEIQKDNKNVFYPLYVSDDVNIPITAVYYRRPKSTVQHSLSEKVLSKTEKSQNMNLVKTDAYNDIDKVVKDVKPTIEDILKELPEEEVNYQTVNNVLLSFDTSYDEISTEDYEKLQKHYESIPKTREEKIKYSKSSVKPFVCKNAKLEHSDRVNNIINLIPTQHSDEIDIVISQLNDERVNINFPGLIYKNTHDIMISLQNNDMRIEDIVQNIADYQKICSINNAIKTLNEIKQTKYDEVEDKLQSLKDLNNSFIDLYEIKFSNFHKEAKDVKIANDFSDYDGIPPIYKNEQNFEGMIDRENDIDNQYVPDIISNEKILLSSRYKNNHGFKDMTGIVLKIFEKIQTNSALLLNNEALVEELYKYFVGIPTKANIMETILNKHDIPYDTEYIENIVKLTPNMVINTENENITEHVRECNKIYLEYLFEMVYTGLCWWTIQIIEASINDFLIFDQNQMMVEYVDKWSLNGAPIDKTAKTGVIVYLTEIANDVFENEIIYTSPTNIMKSCMKMFEEKYVRELEFLQVNSKQPKSNKGREAYKSLKHVLTTNDKNEKIINEYVKALIYMPGYKFKKIHKFLLGCCLQKIGEDFVPDSDIIGINRTDLRDAKKKFSKYRDTVKKSKRMYYITDTKKHDEDKIKKTSRVDIYMKDNVDIDVSDWLETCDNLLFPDDIISLINKSGTKELQGKTKAFIEVFVKTSGNKSTVDFDNLLFQSNILNVLKLINTTLIWYPGNDDEALILREATKTLTDIMRKIPDLNKRIHDGNKNNIRDMNNYILARALCLPFNPNVGKNEILKASVSVSYGFVKDLTNKIYNTVLKYITHTKMPSVEDNILFINSIREKNKNEQLRVMNKLTPEERQLEKELKMMGISEEQVVNQKQDVDYDDEEDVDFGDNDDEND